MFSVESVLAKEFVEKGSKEKRAKDSNGGMAKRLNNRGL